MFLFLCSREACCYVFWCGLVRMSCCLLCFVLYIYIQVHHGKRVLLFSLRSFLAFWRFVSVVFERMSECLLLSFLLLRASSFFQSQISAVFSALVLIGSIGGGRRNTTMDSWRYGESLVSSWHNANHLRKVPKLVLCKK
jgi:hypothetical protein